MNVKEKCILKGVSLVGLFILVFLASPMVTVAQDYPNKPITLYVGFPPGGGGGNLMLAFAEGLKKYLNQPVLVNFKPGASTAVAADFVLKQPADGYSLFHFPNDIVGKLAKDGDTLSFTMEDFIRLGIVGFTPHVLVVRKENYPVKTFEEFLDYARKRPGQVSCGNSGIGSGPHLSTLVFMSKAGIKLNIIPFPGGAPVMTNLVGGHIDSTIVTTASAGDHIKPGGALRTLVVFDPKRVSDLPDVPTSFEKGYNIKRGAWSGLAVRKGTPQPVLNTLVEACKKALNDPQIKASISKLGFLSASFEPEELNKEAKEEYDLAKEAYK